MTVKRPHMSLPPSATVGEVAPIARGKKLGDAPTAASSANTRLWSCTMKRGAVSSMVDGGANGDGTGHAKKRASSVAWQ